MAVPYTCHNARSTKSSHASAQAVCCAKTPALTEASMPDQTFALALVQAFALVHILSSTNKLY